MLPPQPVAPRRLIAPPPAAMTLAGDAPRADAELAQAIAEADHQTAAALGTGYAVGLDVLGDIDLPPGAEEQVDRAQMRALGALYLAADLESARVIAAAERLAALAATGAVNLDLGGAAPLLHQFWRRREERIDAAERAAFFSRLFGTSYGPAPADGVANMDFEPLMLDLCESLYRLDELASGRLQGGIAQQSRLRAAARNLISNLVLAGGGITAFLAAEVVRVLKEALAILTHEDLRGIFMARDVWGVVAGIDRLARVRGGDPRPFVRRGRAGMTVIVWLADAAEALATPGRPLVRLDHPVVASAIEWLQSSLTIIERQERPPAGPAARPPGSGYDPAQVSQWAEIGI